MDLRRCPPAAPKRLTPSPCHPQPKASDTLPLPLYLTNTIFFTLFFSIAYYLLNHWRDKIRTSTPLHLLNFSEISAIVTPIASLIYLLGFFGIDVIQSFISRASHDACEEEEHQRRQQQHLSQHRQILPPTPLPEPLASSDDEEYVCLKWKRFHSCRSGWESFKAVRLSGGVGKTMPWGEGDGRENTMMMKGGGFGEFFFLNRVGSGRFDLDPRKKWVPPCGGSTCDATLVKLTDTSSPSIPNRPQGPKSNFHILQGLKLVMRD